MGGGRGAREEDSCASHLERGRGLQTYPHTITDARCAHERIQEHWNDERMFLFRCSQMHGDPVVCEGDPRGSTLCAGSVSDARKSHTLAHRSSSLSQLATFACSNLFLLPHPTQPLLLAHLGFYRIVYACVRVCVPVVSVPAVPAVVCKVVGWSGRWVCVPMVPTAWHTK